MSDEKLPRMRGAMIKKKKLVVTAPDSYCSETGSHVPSKVQSVELELNEEVEWHWTHTPDGSYISGYTIHLRQPKET